MEVSCDSANRAFLKLSRHYRRGDRVYVAPNEDGYLGCVAYSASGLVEGVNMTKLIAEKVSCKGLTYNASALDTILDKTIPIGRTNGIPF